MVIVKILGGLGNQLFQYAFGRAIESKTSIKVYFDVEELNGKYRLRKNSLGHFNTQLNAAPETEVRKLNSIYNKTLFKLSHLTNGIFDNKLKIKYLAEINHGFDESIFKSIHDNLYLNGYWQSEKFFLSIAPLIRKEFQIITPINEENSKMLERINSSDSVSVHIRRGDYLSNPSAAKIYAACSLEYYNVAFEHIAQTVSSPTFFIFSDDIEWAKNNLKCRFQLVFVDINNGDAAYEDLRLMSACKHNIIANSTFSWWGAWLNNNESKIVISPKKWFIDENRSIADLIPHNWIKI